MNIISNFAYLKKTSIEKYYRDLVKAENVSEARPEVTKFIIRKVMEDLLRTIVYKNSEDKLLTFNQLMDRIEQILPQNIYEYIRIIRFNTDSKEYINLKDDLIRSHIQLLGLIHVVLVWYLKNVTEEMPKNKVIKFEAPSTIETDKKTFNDVTNKINIIDIKISELRNQIINQNNDLADINDIREKINSIKVQRNHLEPYYSVLKNKIREHEEDLLNVDEDYEISKKKIHEIDKEIWESYQSIVNKERMLINAEQEKREFDALMKQLEQKNEQSDWNEKYVSINLENIRETYKKINELNQKYNKVLEKIKFSYDRSQEKLIDKERITIRRELNFEDKSFNDQVELYLGNMNAIKNRTKMLKEMFYDTTLNNSVHREFARSFFNLEGMQLRVFYTILTKINNVSVLVNKSKDILSKSSDDVFVSYIKDNAKMLENASDEEIKLKLYYRLMEISKLKFRDFDNRLEFIKTLDEIVDKAYDVLSLKKDFKYTGTKLDSIKSYYLSKMEHHKSNEEVITEKNLINTVYNLEFIFNQNREEELIPLFVMQCIITDRKSYDREYNMDNHEKLIKFWQIRQSQYSMIFTKAKEIESELIDALKEKQEINKNINILSKAKSELGDGHAKYDKEFKEIILNSSKLNMLPSYSEYQSALIKKKESEDAVNETKNKLGLLKSVLSADMWKNQSEKFINSSNMSNIEKKLMEEAKDSPHFKEEYADLSEHIEKVENISKVLEEKKELLKVKSELINEDKIKIKEFQKQLKIIKDEYPDMRNRVNSI